MQVSVPFFYPTADVQFKGKSLIVPIVSAANVSQLAADLLIASLSLRRVGIFNPKDLIPLVSGREDGEEGITTPLELYGQANLDILVVQQRSPALKVFKEDFVHSLLSFIQDAGIASVLFLSGVDLSNRTDAQMFTATYHIHPPNTPPLTSTLLARIAELGVPAYTSRVPQHPQHPERETAIPFVPGGGLTRRILSSIPDNWSIPTACLLEFVLEGDNRADAHVLANMAANVLDIKVAEWKQPTSWKQGLFGAPHDQTLYG